MSIRKATETLHFGAHFTRMSDADISTLYAYSNDLRAG
jgi:hypothetical protein